MATDMLLPVIFSELVDSDDKKQTRGKTAKVDKAETSVGFFPEHNKGAHYGGSISI